MNEDESCQQLVRKLETLSSDSDSQATKSILKLIQRLQKLIPGFIVPGDLELIRQDAVFQTGTKRKTRSSRQSNRSSALSKKPKRRKLSNSQVFSDSDRTQSMTTTILEMGTIPEEVPSPSNLMLDATYVKPSAKKSQSASNRVSQKVDAQNTLLASSQKSPQVAENTLVATPDDIQSPPPAKKSRFQSTQSQSNKTVSIRKSSLKDKSVVESSPQREIVDLGGLSNNSDNSGVRSSLKSKNESLPKVSTADNLIVADPVSQSQSGSLGKLSKTDIQSVAESVSQKPSGSLRKLSKNDKSSRVDTSSQREIGFEGNGSKTSKSLKSPKRNTETVNSATNVTTQSVEANTEQLKGNSNQEFVYSEIMTEDEEDDVVGQLQQVPAKTPVEVPISTPVDVPPRDDVAATNSTVSAKRPLVKSAFPFVASTPSVVPLQHSTPWSTQKSNWLSRLGWMTASKTTAPTPAAPTQATTAAASKTSFQPQTAKVAGKIKTVLNTKSTSAKTSSTFSGGGGGGGGTRLSKPVSSSNFSLGSNQRPPTMSRFNNNLKNNCSTIVEKSFGGGAAVHGVITAVYGGTVATTNAGRVGKAGASIISAKEQAERERRERILAEMTEKEERLREAQERKALEHKAKVKAANERRAAVRANAEALAKKQEEEKLKRLYAAKEKPPAFNPPKSANLHGTVVPSASHALVKQPFGISSANFPAAAATTSSSHTTAAYYPVTSTNYMKNFDFVKVQPPPQPQPLPPLAAQVNQQKTHAPVTSEAPISYDLAGILDEYTSDSEDEHRRKKRPIPSWARSDSPFLVEMVSKAYRGELRWQNIFRPAEHVHFDDADLFHGYKFRTRRRGSSAVWISPSKQPHQQKHHSVTSKSSLKSSTAI